AAVRGFLRQPLADVLVERMLRGGVGAEHCRLVALVQADGMRAGRAAGEVHLHLGVLLRGELAVDESVKEGLLQLAALVRHARLFNSSTSASSASTWTLISIACAACT